MFFPERITSIRAGDRVLEVGPGATPHPRADEFLEYDFPEFGEAVRQRGGIVSAPDYAGRKVTRYTGDVFPYRDGEFDYVIASHVIEHVADPVRFAQELCRVGGGRGYIEFPLPTYEYLYDFAVHQHWVWLDASEAVIRFVPKSDLAQDPFGAITAAMQRGLEQGWDDLVALNLPFFFSGLEYLDGVVVERMHDLHSFSPLPLPSGRGLGRRVGRKVARMLRFLD